MGEHSPGSKIIPVSVALEQKIFGMSDEEKEKYLLENKTKSKLAQIIQSGFESIQLVNFFTCGEDEVRGTYSAAFVRLLICSLACDARLLCATSGWCDP